MLGRVVWSASISYQYSYLVASGTTLPSRWS